MKNKRGLQEQGMGKTNPALVHFADAPALL